MDQFSYYAMLTLLTGMLLNSYRQNKMLLRRIEDAESKSTFNDRMVDLLLVSMMETPTVIEDPEW
jgi:hypothetical protein